TNIPSPMFTANMTAEDRQQAMRDYQERQAAFWKSPEGQKLQRQQHSYVLLFETNGSFHVESVEPGVYWLNIHITNPDRGMNYYETIGSQSFNVTVPAVAGASATEPFDVGEFKLPIRGMMRLGRRAPPFVTQTFDGKPVKLAD